MSPSPLSPDVLHVLVQYISPPSQLTQPLPPHLLSKPLLQRHHFLHLSPEQPDDYLCWPSSPERSSHVIHLLESRARPIDDDEPVLFPIEYTFDGEDFYAHVDLSCATGEGPRLILQWDESGDWKYHNTDLMPFPPGSRADLEDVLVPPPPPNPVVSLHPFTAPSYPRSFDAADLEDDDDDDYWNAYGATDVGDSFYGQGAPPSAKDTASSEDAYWAQYSSVQGTADSTVPSPVQPNRRKPLPPLQTANDVPKDSPAPLPVPVRLPSEDTYAEPLPIPPSIMPRPRSKSNRWDPASPTTLARLLSTISPRESPAQSPAVDVDSYAEEVLSSPTIGGSDDSESSASPGLGLQGMHDMAVSDVIVANGLLSQSATLPFVAGDVAEARSEFDTPVFAGSEDEDEADLRAALEGVWRMWKRTKKGSAALTTVGDSKAREAFLRTAQLVADQV